MQAAIDNTAATTGGIGKRGLPLLLSGVVIIGAATAIYMSTRSNSLFKKIRELEEIQSTMMSYSTLRINEDQTSAVLIKFRQKLDDLVGELPDN